MTFLVNNVGVTGGPIGLEGLRKVSKFVGASVAATMLQRNLTSWGKVAPFIIRTTVKLERLTNIAPLR